MSSSAIKSLAIGGLAGFKFGVYEHVVTHADYTGATQGEAEALPDFPANVYRGPATVEVTEAWTDSGDGDGDITEVTLILGDAGDTDELVAGLDGFTAAGAVGRSGNITWAFEAAYAPLLTATSGSGEEINRGATGEAKVRILYLEPLA